MSIPTGAKENTFGSSWLATTERSSKEAGTKEIASGCKPKGRGELKDSELDSELRSQELQELQEEESPVGDRMHSRTQELRESQEFRRRN